MALSANRTLTLRNVLSQRHGSMTIKTGSKVYKHALLVADDAGTECLPAANAATTMFLGLAEAEVSTGNGTRTADFVYDIEAAVPSSGVTAGNIGEMMYCKDDEKICVTATLGPKCGVMVQLSSTNVVWLWVRGGGLMGKAS